MFTGIIEDVGVVVDLKQELENLHLTINCGFTNELKVDQSVSHNGVCLTVVDVGKDGYKVTAIQESLERSNLGNLKPGDPVNLERGLKLGDRLDGHIVQGHVDQTAECIDIKEVDGSWIFSFNYDPSLGNITIPKGSITINGVSLTIVDSNSSAFSVAIIPFTFEHTTFKNLKIGSIVNLEFDVIGKYVARIQQSQNNN